MERVDTESPRGPEGPARARYDLGQSPKGETVPFRQLSRSSSCKFVTRISGAKINDVICYVFFKLYVLLKKKCENLLQSIAKDSHILIPRHFKKSGVLCCTRCSKTCVRVSVCLSVRQHFVFTLCQVHFLTNE